MMKLSWQTIKMLSNALCSKVFYLFCTEVYKITLIYITKQYNLKNKK